MNPNSQLSIITLNESDITDFAAARNSQLARVKTPWVLFLDSDETVTPELEKEITEILNLKSNIYSAYYLKRQDTFLGRVLKHGETGKAKFVRLAKGDFGQWVRPVHEVWQGKGRVGELEHPLLHNPHESISSFLDKINRYSTIDAQYRKAQGD
jgi:Glycosyl transferase family 2.